MIQHIAIMTVNVIVCSYVKDPRVMDALSVLLGVDLAEAAEAQGNHNTVHSCHGNSVTAADNGDPYVDPTSPPPPSTKQTTQLMDTTSSTKMSNEKMSNEKTQVSYLWNALA